MQKEFYARYSQDRKRVQLLKDHLRAVSHITFENASKIGLGNVGKILGLNHDLGKYGNRFQNYIREDNKAEKGKIDHSTAGGQIFYDILSKSSKTEDKYRNFLAEIAALCCFSHHSNLIDMLNIEGKNVFEKRKNKKDNEAYKNEVLENIEPEIKQELNDIDINTTKAELENIVSKIEKIENFIPKKFYLGMLAKFLLSCLIDGDHSDSASFELEKNTKIIYGNYSKQSDEAKCLFWQNVSDKLEARLNELNKTNASSDKVNKIRQKTSDSCLKAGQTFERGCYKLEVPTGGGKTLASFRFAVEMAKRHKIDRIIYCSPFTTIIEQNADVIEKIVETDKDEKGKIVLEHHSNLSQKNKTEEEIDLNELLTQSWDAPIIFTTNVRILEILFGGKTSDTRRLHQLANSIIIFDEIQTLPIKCVHIFNNAMNFLVDICGATVVLCTATQPLLNDVDKGKGAIKLSQNPNIISNIYDLFNKLDRVGIIDKRKRYEWKNKNIARYGITLAYKNNNCLIVCNATKSAREIFQIIQNRNDKKINLYHLSARMCPAHRKNVLKQIIYDLNKQRKKKLDKKIIVVSTQVIEAGIDIDFNCGIRALAGFDSIIQTAGRINRNGNIEKSNLYVLNFCEDISPIESIVEGKQIANRILNENKSEVMHFSPEIMKKYYEYYFYQNAIKMTFLSKDAKPSLLERLTNNKTAIAEYKRMHASALPHIFLKQAFKEASDMFCAIDAPTSAVIVPYGKGQEIIDELCKICNFLEIKKLLKEAQQYSVNVYPDDLKKYPIKQLSDKIKIFYLMSSYYNSDFGITGDSTLAPSGTGI